MRTLKQTLPILLALLFLAGCGGSTGGTPNTPDIPVTPTDPNTIIKVNPIDDSSPLSYKGLQFYYPNMTSSQYKLNQLTDNEFEALDDEKQLVVANKLLTSLFYGYPLASLKSKIAQGNFLTALRNGLDTETTDKAWLENHILDDTIFRQYQSAWYHPQAITILTRFYAMKKLDRYFLHNWIAYILTQTIMFSPAYELSSSHAPNIAGVYNRLVTMLGVEGGMRFITYVHMSSEDNWRRFRSPEDNGREMLEIYLMDADDAHVPLAGKALQNWRLNTESDTLEVGLNRNTNPLSLFGTTVYNGDDFYRELAKSDAFVYGVTRRLVDFFFPHKSASARTTITDTLVSSHPETWQDILLQILFSEEYLLHNPRPQSAEETFFSLAKKIHYRNRRGTFRELKSALEEMHQASMKYKLGKLERVPLDTLSFAHYHKFFRERMLLRRANPDQTNHDSWNYDGWQEDFITFSKFTYDENDPESSLTHLVNYLFETIISRQATPTEQALFHTHMLTTQGGQVVLKYEFNMCYQHDDTERETQRRERGKREITLLVMDYLSRLDAVYQQNEVH